MGRRRHAFLCPFDGSVPGGPEPMLEPGRWHKRNDILERLATAMPIRGNTSVGDIRSIPGVWAHASSFFDLWEAGTVEDHPLAHLREEVVASWRGLLALVALSESSDFDLQLGSIDVTRQTDFLLEALANIPRELLNTAPEGSTAAPSQLGYVLYADGGDTKGPDVAGLCSPITLVLPSREFPRPKDPRITWLAPIGRSGYPLGDPAKATSASR